MIKTLYVIYDGDSYEVEILELKILSIWRYSNNQPRKPEFVNYDDCDDELRARIDDKLLALYGDPT